MVGKKGKPRSSGKPSCQHNWAKTGETVFYTGGRETKTVHQRCTKCGLTRDVNYS